MGTYVLISVEGFEVSRDSSPLTTLPLSHLILFGCQEKVRKRKKKRNHNLLNNLLFLLLITIIIIIVNIIMIKKKKSAQAKPICF